MTRRFIIDTDTASDDAVAILMALQWPDVQVDAITVTYGNMPLETASANARYTVEVCGKETPVYEGCAKPLLRQPAYADWFHGAGLRPHFPYPGSGADAGPGCGLVAPCRRPQWFADSLIISSNAAFAAMHHLFFE
jgi:inosine-uridine nucleoside N-ribohydrolase